MESEETPFVSVSEAILFFENILNQNNQEDMKSLIEKGPNFQVSKITYELFELIINVCSLDSSIRSSNQSTFFFIKTMVNVDVQAKRISNHERKLNTYKKKN